jgi:cytochrome c-type biogenesis protein CcmF
VLRPTAFINVKGNEGIQPEPDSRHYWDHDVFTYITSLPDPVKNKDTAQFINKWMQPGDSFFYSKGFAILEKLTSKDSIPVEGFSPGDTATVASFKIYSKNSTTYRAQPALIKKGGEFFTAPDTVISENLVFQVNELNKDKASIGVKESNAVMQYVTLKAYKFPFINLLWLGVIITATGIVISMVRRIKLNRINAG